MMENLDHPLPGDERELDFGEYLAVVRRYWIWIILLGFAGATLAAFRAYTAPLMYRVEVLLAPSEQDMGAGLRNMATQLGPLSGLVGLPGDAGPEKAVQAIATLTTPAFIGDFVAERELLPLLFAKRWDEETESWRPHWRHAAPTLDDGYERLTGEVLRITRDKDSGFWTLQVVWSDRHMAAAWAAELVQAVNQHVRTQSKEEAERAIDYLGTQLEATANVAVRDSIFSLMEGQMNRQMLASIRPDFALKVIGPPVVPAAENFAYPRRKVLMVFGAVGGIAFGLALAFILERRRLVRRRRRQAQLSQAG